jgi:hypothetical protein
MSVSVAGEGWSGRILNALAAVESGGSQEVTVYVSAGQGAAESGTLTLSATSESDPTKTAAVTVQVTR